MGKLKNAFNSKTLRIGGYSIIAGVVVIAIAVAVNMWSCTGNFRLSGSDHSGRTYSWS